MNRSYQLAAVALFVCSLSVFMTAHVRQSSRDAAARSTSQEPRGSFLYFTLKRINSSDTNYGQCLVECRTVLLDETVRNGYFWSNVVALGLLACLFLIIVYQHRVQTRREWTTAEIIGQLEQNLARSRAQVDETIKKNRDLTDALGALRESALRRQSLPLESPESTVSTEAKARTMNSRPASPPSPKENLAKLHNGGAARTSSAKEPIDQMRLFTPDVDFVMKLNSLEQQLTQSREDNKQLRRRIADGDRRLEAEQGRNRALKGA